MLEIKNLSVAPEGDKFVLKGFNLKVGRGEIHAIMGPNGAGKSTLTKVLGGYPLYQKVEGEVLFDKENLLMLAPEERVYKGFFMGFQYPLEIPGVSNFQFLKTAYNAKRKVLGQEVLSYDDFEEILNEKMTLMEMDKGYKWRGVNEGFSGGEKKKNEILQMAVLDPTLAVLDETDSGLDIDAMRIVAKGINTLMTPQKSLILITHYQRLLDYIKPDYVHVLVNGKIVRSGKADLALELEEKGYDWLNGETND